MVLTALHHCIHQAASFHPYAFLIACVTARRLTEASGEHLEVYCYSVGLALGPLLLLRTLSKPLITFAIRDSRALQAHSVPRIYKAYS